MKLSLYMNLECCTLYCLIGPARVRWALKTLLLD